MDAIPRAQLGPGAHCQWQVSLYSPDRLWCLTIIRVFSQTNGCGATYPQRLIHGHHVSHMDYKLSQVSNAERYSANSNNDATLSWRYGR